MLEGKLAIMCRAPPHGSSHVVHQQNQGPEPEVAQRLGGKKCELCHSQPEVYCQADEANLCSSCDEKVHTANFIVSRHVRVLLCGRCGGGTSWRICGARPSVHKPWCEGCLEWWQKARLVVGDHQQQAQPSVALGVPSVAVGVPAELERIPWQPGVVHPEELQGVLNQKSWAKEEVVRAAQGACQHSCPHHGVEEAGQVEDGHRDGCARTAVYERLESPVSVLTVSGGSRKRCHSHFSDDEADDDEHEPQEQLDEEESAGSNCEYCEAATAAEGRASVEDSTAGASGDASPEGQGQLEVQNLYPAYATQARSHLSQTSCSHVSSSKRQRTDGAHVAAQMPSSPVAESPSAAAAAGAGSGAGVASAPGRPAYSLGQSAAMRLQRVLARWHWDLKLGREDTAALAFHLFRRLLIKVQPSLVGTEALRVCLAACLWTAAKLEESQTDVPKAADVSAATGISERQLLAAEKNLLVALDWRLLEGWVRRVE